MATKNQNKILELEVKYYKKLYESTNPCDNEVKKYITETEISKQLDESESNQCEGEVTEKECTEAIFKMKFNKSPGLDGLTVEFYRQFWNNLKNIMVKVFNNNYEKKELTNSQKKRCDFLNI